ncbi:MAG: GTPase [Gemmataceae bacterium]
MLPHPDETIAALATARGPGARAVVRLSGPDALRIALTFFQSDPAPESGRRDFWSGALRLPTLHSPLPADLYQFPGPRSYTGQDVVELHTVSCPPLVDRLVAELLNAGARAARPGEFTLRAFLAGKLDLPKAEAVLGVIEADDDAQLRESLAQLAGNVTRPLDGLRDDLLNLLADVEAGLDFVDEDISFVEKSDAINRLAKALAQVTLVRKQLDARARSDRPFRAALVGRPNAGKSRLFNALGGDAIVSDVPGTTRDYLTLRLDLGGVAVELIDTAGRQSPRDAIDEQAQQLGRGAAASADLLLVCVVAGTEPDADERDAIAAGGIAVATQCDRAAAPDGWLATSRRHRARLGRTPHC